MMTLFLILTVLFSSLMILLEVREAVKNYRRGARRVYRLPSEDDFSDFSDETKELFLKLFEEAQKDLSPFSGMTRTPYDLIHGGKK